MEIRGAFLQGENPPEKPSVVSRSKSAEGGPGAWVADLPEASGLSFMGEESIGAYMAMVLRPKGRQDRIDLKVRLLRFPGWDLAPFAPSAAIVGVTG